jgi:hypothetical protein
MSMTPHLAQKHIEDAARLVGATEERLQEESSENRKAYERFYHSLALYSGGTIALSVTYLGYLKSLPGAVQSDGLLIASWEVLLVCLICSLFSPFLHTHYMHFARLREYVCNRAKQREREAEGLDYLDIVNVRSKSEQEALRDRLKKAATAYITDEKWAAKREQIYMHLWIWAGRTARCTFVLGLILLLWFAIRNL